MTNSAATLLHAELNWLERVIEARIRAHCGPSGARFDWAQLAPPTLEDQESPYAEFVRAERCGPKERAVLALALAAAVRPQVLDAFFTKNANIDRPFTEFGCVVAPGGALKPTAETALFVIAGDDLEERFDCYQIFDSGHPFFFNDVLILEADDAEQGNASGRLRIASEYLDAFTLGHVRNPRFGPAFPAKLLRCPWQWDDLVLEPGVLAQIREIQTWMTHRNTLLDEWGLGRRLGRGHRCLFHGPSGTGKTMTAALLGKDIGTDVYRIDLSLVISKYIGETEKNLENIFRYAEHLDCILFFDEADALFGKRTAVSNAHDRYANQEVSYLLQRLEDFDGLALLATNLKGNIDDAFGRRFQSVVYFPVPRPSERLRLWRGAFSSQCTLAPEVKLEDLAERFELVGGAILNVVRHCSLAALSRGSRQIDLSDIMEGIRREYAKEGRSL